MGFSFSSLVPFASAGSDLLGTILTNEANKDIANSNNAWSEHQYNTRYQNTVTDMKAAGLNPMLAYSNSPGSAPTAQAVQMQNPDIGGSAVEGASVAKLLADTITSSAQGAKAIDEIPQADLKAKFFNVINRFLDGGAASSGAGLSGASPPANPVELHGGSLGGSPGGFKSKLDALGQWNPFGLPDF
ncbi:MAG: DNA pilot protein [Microvirus sp.]|nr:MAG: DNA pilot protein [Microvirus sp.]